MRNVVSAVVTAIGLAPCLLSANDDRRPAYPEHLDPTYYLDPEGERQPIESPADLEIRRRHVLEHMQSVMGPLPSPETPVPLGMEVVETERIGTFTRQKITYHTDSPEQVVAAYLFVPAMERGERRAAVLCLHPTSPHGKGIVAGLAGTPSRHYALELAERGYVTLAPDYPSFGDAAGYDFAGDDYESGTMKAIYDNIRAVDLLQSLPQVDAERIGAIGHSLGGHNAMFTAAFEPRIKALVSSCGFTRFHKYYEGNLKGWTSDRYMPSIAERYGSDPDRVPFDFPEIVAILAPRAFFASAPLHDDNFDVGGVRETIAAARPVYARCGVEEHLEVVYPDSGHDFPDEARQAAYRFLDRHLRHEPATE